MSKNFFKWKQFQPEIIMLCLRWYLKYSLTYRNMVEMMAERGLSVVHTTIKRWVIQYSPISQTTVAIIHCQTQKQAEFIKDKLDKRLQSAGLELHPEKTKIVYCSLEMMSRAMAKAAPKVDEKNSGKRQI